MDGPRFIDVLASAVRRDAELKLPACRAIDGMAEAASMRRLGRGAVPAKVRYTSKS